VLRCRNTLPELDANASSHPPSGRKIRRAAAILQVALMSGRAARQKERILKREVAEAVVNAARGFEGPLGVRVEDKRQGPPKLHDLPSLQKLCGSRFGWPANKTLAVAQELYDGQGKKIITYGSSPPRCGPSLSRNA
jgi:DNA topoisomerase IA